MNLARGRFNQLEISEKVERDIPIHGPYFEELSTYVAQQLDTAEGIGNHNRNKIQDLLKRSNNKNISLGGSFSSDIPDPIVQERILPEVQAPNSGYNLSDPEDIKYLTGLYLRELRRLMPEHYDELMESVRQNQPEKIGDPRAPKTPFAKKLQNHIYDVVDGEISLEEAGFKENELTDEFKEFLAEISEDDDLIASYYTLLGSTLGRILNADQSIELRRKDIHDPSKSNLLAYCTIKPFGKDRDISGQSVLPDMIMRYDPEQFVDSRNPGKSDDFDYFRTEEYRNFANSVARHLLLQAFENNKRNKLR